MTANRARSDASPAGRVSRLRNNYEQLTRDSVQKSPKISPAERRRVTSGKTLSDILDKDSKSNMSDANHNKPRSERRSKTKTPPRSPRQADSGQSDIQLDCFNSVVCANIDLCVPNRTALIVQKFQDLNVEPETHGKKMEEHHARLIVHHSRRSDGSHSSSSNRRSTPESSQSDSSTNHESDVTGEDGSDLFADADSSFQFPEPASSALDDLKDGEIQPEPPFLEKWQRVVQEFVDTEKSYVQKLQLISQDFQKELRLRNLTEKMLPDNIPPLIFSNIETMYMFHKVHLLPRMEECTLNSTNGSPKQFIGDVFKKHAPFLKMYTEYVKNFDNAMQTFQLWQGKSNKFAKFVQEFQQRLKCGHLTIQNHMLEPIQRIPRYELLLREYLKHMPEEFSDREDAKGALELITGAAAQINEVRKFMEKTAKLLEIQGLLQENSVDLMSPGRELVKEGRVLVLSNKTKENEERHLYLFNDMVLLCKTITQPPRLKYKVSNKVNIAKLEVIDAVPTPTSLTIMAQEDIMELHFGTIDEKDEWITTFHTVVQKWKRLRNTRTSSTDTTDDNKTVGEWAPVFINFQDASACMLCMNEFTTLRRRHHCYCCGSVVCTRCCNYKAILKYNQQEKRVCSLCFAKLERNVQRLSSSGVDSEGTSSPTELS